MENKSIIEPKKLSCPNCTSTHVSSNRVEHTCQICGWMWPIKYMNKISVEELDSITMDWKAILKAEGNTSAEEPQFKEWWEIFRLTTMCDKAGLSELEKWCVLRGRYKIERKD